jgi:chromosome segregation ATPase
MKDQADRQTTDIFESAKRGRGRPVTGQAMTNADRQKAYRQRLKSGQVIKLPTVTEMLNMSGETNQEIESLRQALDRVVMHRDELLRELRQVKDEINQLKTVTVTKNRGQGDLDQSLQLIETLEATVDSQRQQIRRQKVVIEDQVEEITRLKAESEKTERFFGLEVRTSQSLRKQLDDLTQDHHKLLVKHDRLLKKRNVT